MKKLHGLGGVILALCMVFCAGRASAFIGTIATTVGVTAGIKSLIDGAIDKATESVKEILRQAAAEATALEHTLTTDLATVEGMTIEDVDALTSESLLQVDSMLEQTLSDLLTGAEELEAQTAKDILDTLHEANLTWARAARDLERMTIQVEKGVAFVTDLALVQIFRVVAIVAGVVIIGLGVLLLCFSRGRRASSRTTIASPSPSLWLPVPTRSSNTTRPAWSRSWGCT